MGFHLPAVEQEPSSCMAPTVKTLGNHFEASQKPPSEFMLRQSKSPWSTMIHSGCKAANLFSAESAENGAASVAAAGFQCPGGGVPAEGVACPLFPDALVEHWGDSPGKVMDQVDGGKVLSVARETCDVRTRARITSSNEARRTRRRCADANIREL
jgi:hypothetical protein